MAKIGDKIIVCTSGLEATISAIVNMPSGRRYSCKHSFIDYVLLERHEFNLVRPTHQQVHRRRTK